MESSLVVCLLFISTLLQAVISQDNNCSTLSDAASDTSTTCSFNNCTSLTCQFPELTGSLTFNVEICADPVQVNVIGTLPPGHQFRQSFIMDGEIYLDLANTLSLTMSRNATHLNLMMTKGETTIVPQVYVPLNPSYCMCESLGVLANITGHTAFIPECSTNENCDGVRCRVNIFGAIYYIENVVLPCNNSIELVIEDSNLMPLHTSVYNESGKGPIVIGGTVIQVDAVVEPREYAMDVGATIDEPLFGRIQIYPRHTIILDRTHCDLPTFTTLPPPTPPTPVPEPANKPSETCLGFYEAIRQNYTKPFICDFLESCDSGVKCTLSILASIYNITISYRAGNFEFQVVRNGDEESLINSTSMVVNITLPSPAGSYLIFSQETVTSSSRSLQLDLYVLASNGLLRKNVLIPYSEIPVINTSTSQTSTLVIATIVPILGILAIALITTLAILAIFLFVRQRNETRPFDFVHMTQSDLEEKDLKNYLDTQQGSFPSTGNVQQDGLNGDSDLAILDLEEKGGTDV